MLEENYLRRCQLVKPHLKPKLKSYLKKWTSCKDCILHTYREEVCTWRGFLPAEVLFIGEGPAESEDTTGKPFMGPGGDILNQWIALAEDQLGGPFYWCIANLVSCFLKSDEPEKTGATRAPTIEEVKACSPHLQSLIDLASPSLLVPLGKSPKQLLKYSLRADQLKIPTLLLPHPGGLLRDNDPAIHNKTILKLAKAVSIISSP